MDSKDCENLNEKNDNINEQSDCPIDKKTKHSNKDDINLKQDKNQTDQVKDFITNKSNSVNNDKDPSTEQTELENDTSNDLNDTITNKKISNDNEVNENLPNKHQLNEELNKEHSEKCELNHELNIENNIIKDFELKITNEETDENNLFDKITVKKEDLDLQNDIEDLNSKELENNLEQKEKESDNLFEVDSLPKDTKADCSNICLKEELHCCLICSKNVSSSDVSIMCNGSCERRQHMECLSRIEGVPLNSGDFLWRCNDCAAMEPIAMASSAQNVDDSPNLSQAALKLENEENGDGDLSIGSPLRHSKFYLDDDSAMQGKNVDDPSIHNLSIEGIAVPFGGESDNMLVTTNGSHSDSENSQDDATETTSLDIADAPPFDTTDAPPFDTTDAPLDKKTTDKTKVEKVHKAKNQDRSLFRRKKSTWKTDCRELIDMTVEYIVFANGSRSGRPKMFDSRGFSYIIRHKHGTSTHWQCVRCNGWQKCPSNVKENEGLYFRSKVPHNHAPTLENFEMAKRNELPFKPNFSKKNITPIVITPEPLRESEAPKTSPPVPRKRGRPPKSTTLDATPSETNISASPPTTAPSATHNERKPKMEPLDSTATPRKSSYSLVRTESGLMLVDGLIGFAYYLVKTTERTKVWGCVSANNPSDNEEPCEAVVKQVGNYFIRSRQKHTHPAPEELPKKVQIEERQTKSSKSAIAVDRNSTSKSSESPSKTSSGSKPAKATQKTKQLSEPAKQTLTKHVNAMQGHEAFSVTSDEKVLLHDYFLALHASGLFLTNEVLVEAIFEFLHSRHPNKDPACLRPRNIWVAHFMRRHTDLADKYVGHATGTELKPMMMESLDSFYEDLHNLVNSASEKLDLRKLLSVKNSSRVFACDAIEVVQNANVASHQKLPDERKRTVSVICSVAANGVPTKPAIINRGMKVCKYEGDEALNHSYEPICSSNGSGNVTLSAFNDWLTNCFHQHLVDEKIRRPALLLLNGSNFWLSYESLAFAVENGIILFHIPEIAAKVLNPLQVSVFPLLNKKYIQSFQKNLHRFTKQLPVAKIPHVFMDAYNNLDISGLAKSAFKSTGLCPFKPKETGVIKESISQLPNDSDSEFTINSPSSTRKRSTDTQRSTEDSPVKKKKKNSGVVLDPGTVDPISLKNGYKLALQNVEKLFDAVVDPAVMSRYHQKLKTEIDYPDTTFLVWRGLQQLKEVPDMFLSQTSKL